MSTMEREHSQDRELVRHHGSSFSSMDRAIPMWDSADPDRAPPPLPMNPGSPTLTTRPNTSAAIMRAAKALEEKARESLPTSSYTVNPMPGRAPERSLVKGNQHKRMQSLQPSSVRDLRSYLDVHKSPERSPERPQTRDGSRGRETEKDYFGKDGDSRYGHFGTHSPSSAYDLTHTPTTRPSHRAILGENTPPSATMKALQTMTIPPHILDPPLQNITNSSTPTPAAGQPLDSISTQLLSITNIVSSLQKDMSQLSRRSKDNATDLISLKEATNSRDEDIRQSLKDLLSTMSEKQKAAAAAAAAMDEARSAPLNLHDPHMTPTKQFTFPRMSSPGAWADERMGSPNPYSVEGAASVAMLEKIIREMVTKDGQERLIANLQVIVDKANGETAKKVSELVEFVKSGSVASNLAPPGSAAFQASPGSGALTRTLSEGYSQNFNSPKAADFVSEEMLNYLRKIKDSAAENGCVTMGTKTLVQELRGEVLGMGRELARKIEEAEQAKADQPEQATQEINAIIQEGLEDLKDHMDKVMRERRRQSMSSVVTRGTVDNNEVYDVVKHALAERGLDQYSAQGAPLDKEAIVSAVREAYDSVEMKPNVEIQQFGLERDEILQCLREGLQDYSGSGAVSREEIGDIVQQSLQQLRLPPPVNEANEMREEILMAVRDSLEELKPSLVPQQPQNDGLTRDVLLDAIKEALSTHEFGPQEVEIPQEALFDAVKAGLEASQPDVDANNEVVVQRIQALVESMHSEFKDYSAANGRDTEQVLDALRDGLDRLGAELQGHFDRAPDSTQHDAIIDGFRVELDRLREDVQGYVAEGPRGDQEWSRGDMVTFIKTELENLHEGLSTKLAPGSGDKEELLAALKAGFDEMNSQVALRSEDADSNEDINDALKHEFDQLKEVVMGDSAGHKNDILEKLEVGFDGLQVGLREATATSTSNDDVLAVMKEEFEHLRETLGASIVKSGNGDKDDIVDAVRELVDDLRAANDTTTKESVTVLQADLEALKESLGGALVPANDTEKAEILAAIKVTLEEIKTSGNGSVNEELLEAFRGELEQIRQSDGLTRQHGRADTEEVLEAVRLGLDDLRSHLEKKLDGPRDGSSSGEIVDALNDGLEGLRADLTKLNSKPVDMTVSYEILDTLKEGIAALREDVALLKGHSSAQASTTREVEVEVEVDTAPTGNEMVLAESLSDGPTRDREAFEEPAVAETTAKTEETSREIVSDSTQRNDVDKMEFILSQIHAKVEAMDANIQKPASADAAATPGVVVKDDLASIEGMLKDVQAAVLILQARDAPTPVLEGVARKEDTDAIETLVANTKAKIEELVFPDPATAVTKENLEDVEIVVRTTSEALDALAKKFEEEGATKTDVTVVQVIADDIKTALDEMKAAKPDDEENPKATKADVDAVSLLVDDLKAKLDDLKIPDPDEIPSKADMEQLTGLIHEFRDSHEKMKDTYEEDILKTANNFDDRRKEAENVVETITEVKSALDTMKEEILINFNEGGSIEGLKTSLATLQDTIGANNVTADVKELMETLTREFERAHGSIEGLQNDHAEKSALHLEKHDEIKGAIVADFTEKLEDKFNILMAKYDDAQLLADEQARVMKEKAEEQEKILETTKTMADELRLTIDTLGATIAGMNERFEEHQTKMGTDSATAFEKLDGSLEKIDGAVAKFEEQKAEDKSEHSHTRDELKNIENIFIGLQDEITEHNPKFMMALREIEALVKAHYDHAQKSKEEAEEHTRAINEEAKARSEEIQNHFANLPKLLPAPPPEPEKYDDAPVQQKLDKLLAIELNATYDDAVVQEKLDKLIGHADDATKAAEKLERLDEIHAQVKLTAVEVSDFVAKQTQLTLEGNESKEREAEELALLVERRSAQKEQLEADLENLRLEKGTYKEQLHAELDDLRAEKEHVLQELKEEKARVMAELKEEKDRTMQELKEEKDSLLAVVASLQAERENLANQKVRLTGEVSSLHTALEIRREELHMMDAKADALERRILNGIMDHSRALMIAKGSKSPSKLKKRMSVDGEADRALPLNATAKAVNMALKPRPAIRRSAPNSSADRRIFSLSQISGNAAPAAKTQLAPVVASSNSGLKRAHSVKTSPRKSSWNGRPSAVVANKENAPLIEEAEPDTENQAPGSVAPSIIAEDVQSEAGTERRYSVASESQYTESHVEGETPGEDGRSNYGSEYTYGSGSYMTGSDLDRRTSYGSTIARSIIPTESAVEGASESEEESEEEDDAGTAKLDASEISGVTGSEMTDVTASEVSEMIMPTESAIDRAVAAVAEELKENPKNFAPTDSGLGTEPTTAALDHGTLVDADYFRRAAEEESVMGSTVG